MLAFTFVQVLDALMPLRSRCLFALIHGIVTIVPKCQKCKYCPWLPVCVRSGVALPPSYANTSVWERCAPVWEEEERQAQPPPPSPFLREHLGLGTGARQAGRKRKVEASTSPLLKRTVWEGVRARPGGGGRASPDPIPFPHTTHFPIV